jgi:beta-lactam-binding protein with PASTA domain
MTRSGAPDPDFFMQFSTRVWSAGRFFAITACLVATYLLFAVTAMRVALKVREVPVPDLRNQTVAEATAVLVNEGLVLNVDESGRLDPKIPAGRIALQEPAPGSITRRQRSIHVWVSQGPRVTLIPSLTGETERSAQLRLQQDGLSVTSLAEVRSAEYPNGTVIAQEPPGAARGTEVALLVNRGEESNRYVMPDLIGVSGARAIDLLRTRGFRVTIVGELPYPGIPPGIVLRQFPSAGFQISAGDPISLEVSR